MKSITSEELFKALPGLKSDLWSGEFWTDGYYISMVSERGDRSLIEGYIANQGRKKDVEQLKLFEL